MGTVKIKDIISVLESIAPVSYQEEYDNSGLLTGNADWNATGVLVTLDCVEEVVDEALTNSCNVIVSHHPIIFRGLKKITGKSYVERTIIKAIKNDIAIYAIHTNLDNVNTGVNKKIADRIGLKDLKILVPKPETLLKLETFIPPENLEEVMKAIHHAGAGNIGDYQQCSFRINGTGTFLPTGEANPQVGTIGNLERAEETRVEVILPSPLKNSILKALREAHPYEEVAYYLTALENTNQEVGAGMIGELETVEEPMTFLKRLKKCLETDCIRHTKIIEKPVKKIAVCGGSGSFLLNAAISQGADVFVSADFKYHEFFDADNRILIADVGHYESEHFTKDLLVGVLKEKFPTFAINFSKRVTNPISYL